MENSTAEIEELNFNHNSDILSPELKSNLFSIGDITNTKIIKESCKQDGNNSPVNFFYGVYVPPDSPTDTKGVNVYTDRNEVLRFIKQNKRARFKAFSSEVDALYFTQYGCTPPLKDSSPHHSQSSACMQEKSVFKAPKTQELVKFRKAIEASDFHLVKKFVEENPRYLVSNGDTPSILQEGSRYNALHVAARCNAAEIASYILDLISSSELTDRIYGIDKKNRDTNQRAKVLLDLFLNTPDKALNETPLHFASKTGSVGVIKVFIFYPECNRTRRNKHGLTPLDVVCTRATGNLLDNKETILKLLKDNYYIPVLRSRDNTTQPTVGDPITLSKNLDVTSVIKETALSPRIEIQALAGPMSEEEAHCFRKMWSSPRINSNSSPRSPLETSPHLRPSLYDFDKGLERIGRKLASEFHVKWIEYWAFLDTFVDLVSIDGLDMLETYLKNKFQNANNTCLTINAECTSSHDTNDNEIPTNNDGYILKAKTAYNCDDSFCLPTKCFQKYLEMVAKRLAASLIRNSSIYNDVYNLETFLTSYSKDKRFECVDLNKSHSSLSHYIELYFKNINDKSDLIEKCKKLLETNTLLAITDEDQDTVKKACICILSSLLDLLSSHSVSDNVVNTTKVHNRCDCKLMRSKRTFRDRITSRKKLQFDDEPEHIETETVQATSIDDLSVQMNGVIDKFSSLSIQDSDSDNEDFFTPPNSPYSSDDDFTELAPVADHIFLGGDRPSKLDAAVLNVIENINITCEEYPFIYYWIRACEQISQTTSRERWPSVNMKLNSSPKQRTLAREFLSPTWIR